MASRFRTDEAGIELIERFEGYAKRQIIDGKWTGNYVSYRPTPESNWTIGCGQEGALFPGTPGEIPVTQGTVITHQQAYDGVRFFVAQIVDPLVDKHFNPRTQGEHNALSSWTLNIHHDRLERGSYSLPALVNARRRDINEIISKWLEYILTPGAESGLVKRRIAELLMFMGLPWNAPAIFGFINTAKVARLDRGATMPTAAYIHPTGKYACSIDPQYVFDLAEGAAERPMTTDELNAAELARMRGEAPPTRSATPAPPKPKPAAVAKAEPIPVPEPPPLAPKVVPAAPPKPMEQSKTHAGLSKAESGKETVAIGATVTGIGALLPNINALTSYLEKFPTATILKTVALIGVIVIVIGLWRWWAGRMIAHEGREQATQPKV